MPPDPVVPDQHGAFSETAVETAFQSRLCYSGKIRHKTQKKTPGLKVGSSLVIGSALVTVVVAGSPGKS